MFKILVLQTKCSKIWVWLAVVHLLNRIRLIDMVITFIKGETVGHVLKFSSVLIKSPEVAEQTSLCQ